MKEVFLSKHASERAQQRGVSRETIALRALHGKRIRVKAGKYQRIIRKPEATKLVALKASLPQSLLDSTKGLRIITSESENQVIVVSVLPRTRRKEFLCRTSAKMVADRIWLLKGFSAGSEGEKDGYE